MLDSLLDQLARRRGIGDAYYDYRGELKHFSAATKQAILAAMGCNVTDVAAVERELAGLEAEHWRPRAPAVTVLRPGRAGAVGVVPAGALAETIEWRVVTSQGERRDGRAVAAELAEVERRDVDGRQLTRRWLPLPEDLPLGEHTLQLCMKDGGGDGTLFVAPARCHEPQPLTAGARLWGLAVQLYTLRSPSNWGIGDFADLREVVRRAAANGAAFVGLNPLHALFPANPGHFSPYSPSSRHFLNVLYIAVPAVEGFGDCAAAQALAGAPEFGRELDRLRATDRVDYPGVARAKLPVLRALYEHFRHEHLERGTDRARAFRNYQAERG